MILGKKKTVLDIAPKEAELSKGNGSDNNGGSAAKEDSNACIWGNKGNALVESSMYAEAIKCYDKAIEINPNSMEAWNNKGLALARTGRLAEAVQCYDKALELNSGDAEVIYNKGIALALLGKSKEAIECYDKLLAINPGDADAWCSRGDVLFETGKFEEALAEYDKSIAIDPKDETAWNNRGMALAKLNRLPEAIESYDKALEINPKVEKIWSNKGLAIAKLGENNNKIDLRKVAASLPREEIPVLQAVGAQPVMPPEGKPDDTAPAPVEPAVIADPAPVDVTAVTENAALNIPTVADGTRASPDTGIPCTVQADIKPDMSTPEPCVQKIDQGTAGKSVDFQTDVPLPSVGNITSINELPGQEAVEPAKKEPEGGLSIAGAGQVNTGLASSTGKVYPDIPSSTSGTEKAPAEEVPLQGQAEIRSDKQKSEPESFIEKAESIANDKLADIEKYLLSLPVDKTAPAAETASPGAAAAPGTGQSTDKEKPVTNDRASEIEIPGNGTAAPDSEIKAAAVEQNFEGRTSSAEGAYQNTVPMSGLKTPPDVPAPPEVQTDMSSMRQELNPRASSDKAGYAADKATGEGKCIVSVPVDAYITIPFIDKNMQGQADAGYDSNRSEPGSFIERPYSTRSEKVKKSEEYLVMGNTLYSLGKYEDAIESYNKSLHIDPGNNTAWNNKGLALGKAGKLDEAIDCYDKVLDISPADYIVLNNKGSALYKKGKYEDALECYRSALDLKPDSKTAKQGIRICMASLNKSLNKSGKTKGRA